MMKKCKKQLDLQKININLRKTLKIIIQNSKSGIQNYSVYRQNPALQNPKL